MKAYGRTMAWLLVFVAAGVGPGCDDCFGPGKTEKAQTKPYPQDFLRKEWPVGPTVGAVTVRRNYLLRPSDQVEIIYHVRTLAEDEDYRVKIRDTISLRFPFNRELDHEAEVQSDGKLHLDLVGSIYVYDKTVEEIHEEVLKRYSKYLKDPTITVTFKDSKREIQDLREAIITSPRGMSRLVPIAPDGYIALPLIRPVQVGGLTIQEAHRVINEEYQKLGARALETTINLHTVSPMRAYVLGEVRHPGVVLNTTDTPSHMTHLSLLQAVAQAGSYVPARAELSKIVLIRKRNGGPSQTAIVNLQQLLMNQGQNTVETPYTPDLAKFRHDIWLEDGDIVYVPTKEIAKRADYIEYVWTRGIYGVFPLSHTIQWFSYGVGDAVDWLGPNPG